MSSLEQVLLTDFWRRGRWAFLMTLVGFTGLPLMLYSALWREGGFEFDSQPAIAMHVIFTLIFGFCAMTAVSVAQGRLARFFPRPISTCRLVVCQLTAGMVAMGLLYLIAASLLNLLVGVNWPLWGPALFLAAAAACVQAAVWWAEGSVATQFVSLSVTATVLCIWFARRYGAVVFGDWHEMWLAPTALELGSLAAFTAAAYMAAVLGVAQRRRGAGLDFDSLLIRLGDWLSSTPRTAGRFHAPAAAELWYEWRQKHGFVSPAIMTLIILAIVLSRVCGLCDALDLLETMLALPMVIVGFVMPMIFGLVLGNCGTSTKMFGMRHFVATRPLSNHALGQSLLATGVMVIGSTWLIWVLSLAAVAGVYLRLGEAELLAQACTSPQLGYWRVPVMAGLTFAGAWGFLGLVTSLSATGRPWMIATLFIAAWATAVAIAFVSKAIAPDYRQWFDQAGAALLGLTALAATGWVVIWTRRQQLVPERTTWLVVAGWLAMVAGCVVLATTQRQVPFVWILHFAALCALLVLPFVSVPLAVAWNRHR